MVVHLALYNNSRDFLEAAGEMLYHRETINNLMLGIIERLITRPSAFDDPFFATVCDENQEIILAAVMTPPHNIILAGNQNFEAGISVLIARLQAIEISVPGVIGPIQIAESFINAWESVTKYKSLKGMHQRVYELRALRFPPMPPGIFQAARDEDVKKLSQWLQAFVEETLEEPQDQYHERAEKLVKQGNAFVWERAGEIVSMALKTRPIAHSITISGVYTPPEHRRKGYATALVALLSDHLLNSGYHFVNLFTDLKNPISNEIYQKVGYHPVCDFRMCKFIKKES